MRIFYVCIAMILLSGCSLFGKSNVEIAPYQTVETNNQQNIELRHYDRLVLVSAPMLDGMEAGQNGAFYKLFDYISGENTQRSEISMTAPVFLNDTGGKDGVEIKMTAPVLMQDAAELSTMSFVLPASMTLETAPLPKDPDLKLQELRDYNVVVITFSGWLNPENIDKHRAILQTWIERQGYEITGPYKAAGYNPPFTIPAYRRNEVLIPVNLP